MNDINVFSINALALDIATDYYLKDYPTVYKDGFLVFSAEGGTKRGAFGSVQVARIAALIPYIVKIYLDYKDSFNELVQKQIDEHVTTESIKILQVVALMSASGRWQKPGTNPNSDPDAVYEEQSIAECKKRLELLGVNLADSNKFAMLLKSNIAVTQAPYALYHAILQDAINIAAHQQPADIENKLQFLNLLNEHADSEVKRKFSGLVQGLVIAKVRQQAVITESETSFQPVTISFKRIFNPLFLDFEETFTALEQKNHMVDVETIASLPEETLAPTVIEILEPLVVVGPEATLIPIHGPGNAETLVRTYEQALVQNKDPTLAQEYIDTIIQADQAQASDYSKRLAYLMLIKWQAGMPVTAIESAFITQQMGEQYGDLQHMVLLGEPIKGALLKNLQVVVEQRSL